MYVNIFHLSQFLQLYDPHKPYYIGKWPLSMRKGIPNLFKVSVSVQFARSDAIYRAIATYLIAKPYSYAHSYGATF